MNIDSLIDFANEASAEIAKFTVNVILSPDKLMEAEDIAVHLAWNSVPYGDEDRDKVPADKRGVYAFAVCMNNTSLPPHGYILYMGIAGKDSDRSLRARYGDYFSPSKVRKRPRIARMIGTWHQVLHFFYAPVDDDMSSDDLKALEIKLNTALMPPFSEGDLEAETKEKRRAFS